MSPDTLEIDHFIAQLYGAIRQIDLARFRHWSLNKLQNLIDFDAALWSTGHLSTRSFHTHTRIALGPEYPALLLEALPINPISKALFTRAGQAVDMADVIADDDFYESKIYRRVFQPYGIERILSSIHIESRSGIYTLLTLYRHERSHVFGENEKRIYQRALYHLIQSAAQACMASLDTLANNTIQATAICDRHGIYHAVEDDFLNLMDEHFPEQHGQQLPVTIDADQTQALLEGLHIEIQPMGDLFRITARPQNTLDTLTQREQQVVLGVTRGLTFKQIAKELMLSPSTVSNHLYRVYQKLNINDRSQLADLIRND